ncbi:DMT family transporter [Nitrosomonadales bacterium]|nr:DMT family transporter [Nitrosomonadales bacterium]
MLFLLFGTITWGLIWYPYRLLDNIGMSAIYSSLFSFSIAIFLGLFFYRLDNLENLKNKHFWIYALVGGITNISYALAVIHGELVRVMLLFFLSPVWTIPFTYWLLKEKIFPKNILAAILSVLGACIILWHPNLLISKIAISDFYAIIGGIGFALTNVLARYYNYFTVKEKSYSIWLGVILIALIVIPFFPLNIIESSINLNILFILFLLGLALLLTTMVVQLGLTMIEAVKASPIFLFEIIVVGISGYYLANEILSLKDFLGGIFIILGVLISSKK